MKWLAIIIASLFFIPLANAFQLGGFEIKDGSVIGKYAPAGLEGCVISCYTDKHVLDIVYKNDSIDVTFDFLDDPLIKKLVNEVSSIKDSLEEELMNKTLRITGPRISFEYPINGCKVELHDTPTRFLRIETNKVVIHDNGNYTINRINENELKLEKSNFTSFLVSSHPIIVDGNNITVYGNMVFVSFSLNEKVMESAFLNKTIGGELFIAGKETDYISYFGNVSVSVDNNSLSKGKIILRVKGDNGEYGKVIKVGIANEYGKVIVTYDGRVINEASSLEDVLNPNDDGSNPEYYKLTSDKEGTFLLISIPHFSEHTISIQFIMENPILKAIALMLGIAVVGVAAFYVFKPQ